MSHATDVNNRERSASFNDMRDIEIVKLVKGRASGAGRARPAACGRGEGGAEPGRERTQGVMLLSSLSARLGSTLDPTPGSRTRPAFMCSKPSMPFMFQRPVFHPAR